MWTWIAVAAASEADIGTCLLEVGGAPDAHELRTLLDIVDDPEVRAPVVDVLVPLVRARASEPTLAWDNNAQVGLLSLIAPIAALRPEQAGDLCRALPADARVRCLASAVRHAPEAARAALATAAVGAAGEPLAPGGRYLRQSAITELVRVLPDVPAAQRATAAAGLPEATARLEGDFGYLVLDGWSKDLVEAGLGDVAAAIARQATGRERAIGLATAAAASCAGGDPEAGLVMAREAAGALPGTLASDDVRAAGLTAAALVRCGDDARGRGLFVTATAAATRDRARGEVLVSLADAGLDAEAQALLPTIEDLSFPARRLAWAGHFELAGAAVRAVAAEDRDRVLQDLLEELGEAAACDAAVDWLAEIRQLRTRAIEGADLARGGCPGALDPAVRAARDAGTDGYGRERVAVALIDAGRWREAVELVRMPIAPSGRPKDDLLGRGRMLCGVVGPLAEAHPDLALELVREALPIVDQEGVGTSDDRDFNLADLARAAHRAGDTALAADIANRIQRASSRPSLAGAPTFETLAATPAGRDKARATARWLEEVGPEAFRCPR